MDYVALIIKIYGLQWLRWYIAIDIEQIAVIAVEGGRPFALAQVAVPGKDMIAQLKPEGIGTGRSSSAIANGFCVPGSFQK